MSAQTLAGLRGGEYHGVKRLKLSNDDLGAFPQEILSLHSTLEILDLSGNKSLSSLPASLSRLHNLRIAFFSDCSFDTFPIELASCRSLEMVAFKSNGMRTIPEGSLPRKLRWLILTGNEISELPKSIGECLRLEKCMLAGNKLAALPEDMKMCRKLGLLRLSCNRFEDLPDWLWELPELAFLSFAGNPFSKYQRNTVDQANDADSVDVMDLKHDFPNVGVTAGELESIPWEDLTIQHLLGKGASGIISQGHWKRSSPKSKDFHDSGYSTPAITATQEVAIKIFHGTLTSDGSPLDELKSCIAVGQHSNVISSLGTITSHPTNERGLVLQLIPKDYINLGLPPNFDTCTRDNFSDEVKGKLSASACLDILRGIASAASHLHSRGVAHGDLYAHNILVDPVSRHAVLGDFGASTLYRDVLLQLESCSKGAASISSRLEKFEVLAFGHLVEDLVGCVVWEGDDDGKTLEELVTLWRLCTGPVVSQRIGFQEVLQRLK